jgi:hypothetical protein
MGAAATMSVPGSVSFIPWLTLTPRPSYDVAR